MDASSHSVSVPCRLMCAASSMMPSAAGRSSAVRSGPSPDGLDVMVACWACCWYNTDSEPPPLQPANTTR